MPFMIGVHLGRASGVLSEGGIHGGLLLCLVRLGVCSLRPIRQKLSVWA